MPARTGAEYIAGLQARPPAIFMRGEEVKDVTTYPGLRNGVQTLARLYDMQHDPTYAADMTYASPGSGEPVGLSFLETRTHDDLERRGAMMRHWARVSCGMMGRTPDFLNVSIMAMAAAGDFFGGNRPEFKQNIQRYYEHVREHDLVLTHTLVNLQRTRLPQSVNLEDSTSIALSVVEENSDGIVVEGVRVLATLPIADEIAVYPARSHRLPGGAPSQTSFAFAIPCNTPGLKFLCRESVDLERPRFDHPWARALRRWTPSPFSTASWCLGSASSCSATSIGATTWRCKPINTCTRAIRWSPKTSSSANLSWGSPI